MPQGIGRCAPGPRCRLGMVSRHRNADSCSQRGLRVRLALARLSGLIPFWALSSGFLRALSGHNCKSTVKPHPISQCHHRKNLGSHSDIAFSVQSGRASKNSVLCEVHFPHIASAVAAFRPDDDASRSRAANPARIRSMSFWVKAIGFDCIRW